MKADICPVCSSSEISALLPRMITVAANNIMCASFEEAIDFPRGAVEYVICNDCGFAFNRSFNPELIKYDCRYENAQSHSSIFRDHMEYVANMIPFNEHCGKADIVEVGCGGAGCFLDLLHKGYDSRFNRVIGFDPAVKEELEGFRVKGYLDRKKLPDDFKCDIFISRHVIEHIHDVNSFIKDILNQLPDCYRGMIETPSIEYIIDHRAYFDIYYEHSCIFSKRALHLLMAKNGFPDCRIERCFGRQYLLAICKKNCANNNQLASGMLYSKSEIDSFYRGYGRYIDYWSGKIIELNKQSNKVGLWGAASKAVSFLNQLNLPDGMIDCCVDINPDRQGNFIPGAGVPIISPLESRERKIGAFIVVNPCYIKEIAAQCLEIGIDAQLISLEQ